jgi:PAS domain-containing protein
MKCLHCRAKLPWLSRLKNSHFCSPEHRELYRLSQDKTALVELSGERSTDEPQVEMETRAEESERGETETPRLETGAATTDSEWEGREAEPRADDVDGESLAREPEAEPLSTDATAIGGTTAGMVGEAQEESYDDDTLAGRYARNLSMVEAERHYYQDLLDRLPAEVAVIGEDLRVVYSNRLFRRQQGQDIADSEQPGVASTEVRDAIRKLLSATSQTDEAEPIYLDHESRSIRVGPVTLLSKDETGAKGVLLFAASNSTKELTPGD